MATLKLNTIFRNSPANNPAANNAVPQNPAEQAQNAPESSSGKTRGQFKNLVHRFGNLPTKEQAFKAFGPLKVKNTGNTKPVGVTQTEGEIEGRLSDQKPLRKPMSQLRQSMLKCTEKKQIHDLTPELNPSRPDKAVPGSDIQTLQNQLPDAEPEEIAALCQKVVADRFKGEGLQELSQALLDLPADPQLQDQQRHQHAQRIATVLSRTVNGDAYAALYVLHALHSPATAHATAPGIERLAQQLAPKLQPVATEVQAQVQHVKRALAQSASGMQALLHLENKQDLLPRQKEAYRHALNLCDHLLSQSGSLPVDQNGAPSCGTLEDFVAHAQKSPKLGTPIGDPDDHPSQLISKALLYAHAKMEGEVPDDVRDAHLPAYLAFCNGFTTSGHGSDLDKWLTIFKKSHKYMERTEHGDRTLGNIAKDTGLAMRRVLTGKGKDPYTALLEHGVGSSPLGTMQQEAEKFRTSLKEKTIDPLNTAMEKRIAAYSAINNLSPAQKLDKDTLRVRQAILQVMQEKGIKGFKIDQQEVLDKLAQHPRMGQVSRRVLQSELNKVLPPGAKRIRLKDLERYAADLYGLPNKPEPVAKLRARVAELEAQPNLSVALARELRGKKILIGVAETRAIANGNNLHSRDSLKLFQAKDLWNLAVRNPPRQALTKEVALETYSRMMATNNDVTRASSGATWGANLGVINVAMKSSPISVIPELDLSVTRAAEVSAGDSAEGQKQTVSGSTYTMSTGIGLRAGVGLKFADDKAVAGAFTGAKLKGDYTINNLSASMFSPLDVKGDEEAPENRGSYQEYGGHMANLLTAVSRMPQEPSNAQMMTMLADHVGDDLRVSFGLTDTRGWKASVQGNIGGGLRFGSADKIRVGAGLAVSPEMSYQSTKTENTGRIEYKTFAEKTKFEAKLGLGASAKTSTFAESAKARVSFIGIPISATAGSINPYGSSITTRVATDENGIRPGLTYFTYNFPAIKPLAGYLNARLDSDANFGSDVMLTGSDGKAYEGRQAIERFILEAQAEPLRGNLRHEVRFQLTNEAASQINLLRDEARDLTARLDDDPGKPLPHELASQLESIEHDIQRIFKDDNSRTIRWLRVVQTQLQSTSTGLQYGVVAQVKSEFTDAHKTIGAKGKIAYTQDAVAYTGPKEDEFFDAVDSVSNLQQANNGANLNEDPVAQQELPTMSDADIDEDEFFDAMESLDEVAQANDSAHRSERPVPAPYPVRS
jgi:hypothetical protein